MVVVVLCRNQQTSKCCVDSMDIYYLYLSCLVIVDVFILVVS